MADIEFHTVMERLLELEARIRATDERQAAIEMVLVLLLAQLPGDDGRRLLARQANELDRPGCRREFAATIQPLDELREQLAAIDAHAEGAKTPPPE